MSFLDFPFLRSEGDFSFLKKKIREIKMSRLNEEYENKESSKVSNVDSKSVEQHASKTSPHKEMTMSERQMMHPLEREDPIAYKFIQFVRLGYLEKEAPVPIPRHQGLPENAFGKLTGRSILVSLSHGWFFQNHPDPRGRKLDLIRNVFAPRLRERYPHTSIVVFFDFLATPQRPRTEDEERRFRIAMERMNSVYVYADAILFLEVDLPDLDMTVHSANVDLAMYTFFDFIDTIQVGETTSKIGPQQSECILTTRS